MNFDFNDVRDQFMFAFFWRDFNFRKLSVLKEEDVFLAVNKAYIDMTPRTIDGLGLSENKINSKTKKSKEYKDLVAQKSKLIAELKNNLAEKIVKKVFNIREFNDEIHKELCEGFINDFTHKIKTLNEDIEQIRKVDDKIDFIDAKKITYGKAQKIVNMSFKYLYFFDNADRYLTSVFEKCHMAIDEYIMVFFDEQNIGRTCKNWSNFNQSSYAEYKKSTDDYCNTDNKIPFFAEFEYWIEGQKVKG